MSKTRGRFRGALVVGVAALTLTGCAGAGMHPGVAVQVGEESITMAEVDEIAVDFCDAVTPQLEQQAETVPNAYFRGGIAGTLALRSIADQVAEDYGITLDGEDYTAQLAQIRRGVAGLPEEVRESVLVVDSAPLYVEEVQASVGEVVLEGEGDRQAFLAAGQEEFATWVAENEVEFDPSLNTVAGEGTIRNEDRSLSFAVSETARSGNAAEPNAVLARRLPSTQRCGR
ncbi:hypothetical protein [Nocardioides coralli]|uniref:hypothetical protein n=1 Tax=Nocardioides coralli TaxID=2872154 RepID=UPI001CA3FA2D|nr:hypothetical protein [Nocardioides coralli]QZY29816.1 hypothetical protein K6T13_03765 [Nocardioides coralli]